MFWDVPKSIMHAVSDIGALVEWLQANIEFGHDSANNLAVLHNQRMVDDFGLSAWVTQSKRQATSRSVTSCADMTAFMVVVAQTKVGFLTEVEGRNFGNSPKKRGIHRKKRHMLEQQLPFLVPAKCVSFSARFFALCSFVLLLCSASSVLLSALSFSLLFSLPLALSRQAPYPFGSSRHFCSSSNELGCDLQGRSSPVSALSFSGITGGEKEVGSFHLWFIPPLVHSILFGC